MDTGIYGSSDDNFSSILTKDEAKAIKVVISEKAATTTLPLTKTGKRGRTEDIDSSGSEMDEVEGTSNDGEEETEEEEVLPAWMRYLPRTHFVSSSSSSSSSTTTKHTYKEPDTYGPISKQPPSSNRFGPTSLQAKSQKRPRITLNNSPNTARSQILPSSRHRIQDKLKRSNVTEAAMLFSLSSGLGANK